MHSSRQPSRDSQFRGVEWQSFPFFRCWNLSPTSYAQHNLKCLLRVSFGGAAFSQLLGSQYVWVHFFPLHGKWLWGPEGMDISGAWPRSSCLYLTVYCDDPVMRTGIVPPPRAQWETCILIYIGAITWIPTTWISITMQPVTNANLLNIK